MRYATVGMAVALLLSAMCGGAPAAPAAAPAPAAPPAKVEPAPANVPVPPAGPVNAAAPAAAPAPAVAPATAPAPAPAAVPAPAPAAAPNAPSAPAAPTTKPYQYTETMPVALDIMRRYGVLRTETKAKDDFGGRADVAVSDNLTVTGVPVEFLKSAVWSELESGIAFLQVQVPLAKLLKGRLDAAKMIVMMWFVPIRTRYAESVGAPPGQAPKPTQAQIIRFDVQRQRARDASDGQPPAVLAADWLFFVRRLDLQRTPPFAPKWQRREVLVRELLDRFEPDAPVTAENADSVAEELVWTKALGLSDGSPKTLPVARQTLQALILESIGYSIGDPGDPNSTSAAAAKTKLNAAKAEFRKKWDATAKQPLPAATMPVAPVPTPQPGGFKPLTTPMRKMN
ncbi:MAG: hypothetical protein NTY65_04450 [Planctomycetota bacterium]|nr:hypothetical protein [Planctomycetota bacterium]